MGQAVRLAIFGDTHFPFVCKKSLKLALRLLGDLEPTHVVQIGDLYDQFSWSKFYRTHNLMTPAEELKRGFEQASAFWEKVTKLAPDSKKYQLTGNHDDRIKKRVLEKLPEIESVVSIESLFNFPKVKVIAQERDELILGDILLQHGFRHPGDHVEHNLMNTVVGHLHRGYTLFYRHGDKLLWELNVGMLADPNSVPLSYTKQRKFATYQQGLAFVDNLGPRFIPFNGGKLA